MAKKSNVNTMINAINKAQSEKMTIVPSGTVGSEDFIVINSNSDKGYIVSVANEKITGCSCPQNLSANKICKHMIKVALEFNKDINALELT